MKTQANLTNRLFDERLKQHPQKVFLTCEDQAISFGEAFDRVCQLAAKLRQLGLQPGERVVLRFWNEIDFAITYFAVLMIDAVAVTISPLLSEAEINHIFNHCGASLIISFERGLHAQQFTVQDIMLSNAQFTISHSENPDSPSDLTVLIYTSGTTASPKGVMLTQSNILSQVQAASAVMGVQNNDSLLGVLSLAHVFGQMDVLWLALYRGLSVHLCPHFEAKTVIETLKRQQASVLIAVPTMYQLLIRHLERHLQELPSLRLCHSGAAPLSARLFSEIETHFQAPIQEGYGLTETCSMAFSNPLEGKRKPLSVGKPIAGVQMKLIDEHGICINCPDQVGEVCIKGPIVTPGYYRELEATKKTFDAEAWLMTGDLGYLDEDGYLFLVDRKKDLIIRAGYKVYPREVEEVLLQHSLVQQAAVVGSHSLIAVEKVTAFIVPTCSLEEAKQSNLPAQLRSLCEEKLAAFKMPNRYELVDFIPKTPSGKLLKRKLRESLN